MAQNLIFRSIKKITYLPIQALTLTRAYAIAPFDESIELGIRLNVDPKRGDQIVRGTCIMPGGLGKTFKIAVFTSKYNTQAAIEAGADIAGEQLFQEIKREQINFDKALGTPQIVDMLKPLGKFLGPRGLMPSTKFGTILKIKDMKQVIEGMKAGSVQFRVDRTGNIHCPVGKVSFTDDRIFMNMKAVISKIVELKPDKFKGKYINSIYMTSTQGPAWNLDLSYTDTSSRSCAL